MARSVDIRIRDAALRRAGHTAAIFTSGREPRNVAARGRVWALMRACRSAECAQLGWQRIARVSGYKNHTTVMEAARRYGVPAAWSLDS